MEQYLANTSFGTVSVNDYTSIPFSTLGKWQVYPTYANIGQIEKSIIEKKILPLKKEIKMAIGKNKRGLFQVILVDPKKKEMILNTLVIADTVEDVLLEVDAGKTIKEKGLQVSEVDKIINILGEIRKTRKSKDTGELEIVSEETKE